MAVPFEKEAAYFYAADFLQDSGKQCSGKYPSSNHILLSEVWTHFCEKLPCFLTCEQEAVQKGIEHFYFPKQTSQLTYVSASGVRGRNGIFLGGSSPTLAVLRDVLSFPL